MDSTVDSALLSVPCPVPGCEALLAVESKLNRGEYVVFEERNAVALTKIDYEYFDEDFDLCCRFLYILSNTDPEMESNDYMCLYKDIFMISCRLKCGKGTHIKPYNVACLEKAMNTLRATVTSDSMRKRLENSDWTLVCSFLIAFSLINIYTAAGRRVDDAHAMMITNLLTNFHSDAAVLTNQISLHFDDYNDVIEQVLIFRNSEASKKYRFEVPSNLMKMAERSLLVMFLVKSLLVCAALLIFGEIYIKLTVD